MNDQQNNSPIEKINQWIKRSLFLKVAVITILVLLLLIPVEMVRDLIREREYRKKEVIDEASAKWGREQTINGLYLSIPYERHTKDYDKDGHETGRVTKSYFVQHMLPEDLVINGILNPEVRYRGIYDFIVYNTVLDLSGAFIVPEFNKLETTASISWKIRWDQAFLTLGISDLRGVQEKVVIRCNGKDFLFEPTSSGNIVSSGISAPIPLNSKDSGKTVDFSMTLNLNGSANLNFIPLGKQTDVRLTSTWSNPSFNGAFLPDEREITADGFTAQWRILELNRPLPQSFTGSAPHVDQTAFGVNLMRPVDEYQKTMRSAKYAILLIALTFVTFFFIQIINKIRIHPIQYLLVGFALCIFYTLLISLSEQIKFNPAYCISAAATIILVTVYTNSIIKRKYVTMIIGGILTILYAFVFIIIQSQDFSLIMGSIGLFTALATIMYLSRNINWYNNEVSEA